MKTSLIKLAGTAFAVLALAAAAHATTIEGTIAIGPKVGAPAVVVNTTANTVTFPSGTTNATVNNAVGDYASFVGVNVKYNSFSYDPFSGPLTLWTINPTTYFVLQGISVISENGVGLSLAGWGTAYMTGKDATNGKWSFSSDSSGSTFNFSTTTVVPDGGLTAVMLGLGLLGLGFAARRQKRA